MRILVISIFLISKLCFSEHTDFFFFYISKAPGSTLQKGPRKELTH